MKDKAAIPEDNKNEFTYNLLSSNCRWTLRERLSLPLPPLAYYFALLFILYSRLIKTSQV